MQINKSVFATCQVEGFHFWPEAPDYVDFLRNIHRHIFYIKLTISVEGANREIEFIRFKQWLERTVGIILKEPSAKSCEMIAEEIIGVAMEVYGQYRHYNCEVSEDGENGAVVEMIP